MREGARGERRFSDKVVLTRAKVLVDEYGHAAMGEPVDVLTVYANVRQMSGTKTMMTYQQADLVGLEIEFRNPGVEFNGMRWEGHEIVFSEPMVSGRLMRNIKLTGYYQIDNPYAGV